MHLKPSEYSAYTSKVKASRAFRLLKAFTRFHRVQLGRGLWEALEWLEYELTDRGPDSLEVSLVEVSVSNLPGSYVPPPSWSVHQAWFEVSGARRVEYEEVPTLVAAHSPPSEGVVNGRMVLIADPLDPRSYDKAKGGIAVVTGVSLPLAYVLAAESGAAAVAFYRRDLPPTATPYAGLFLPVGLIRKYGIPAVSLPQSLAATSDGREARLFIDSDLSEASKVPILELTVYSRDSRACEEAVSAVAHACHPEPGANDNGSGVAASVEALLAIAESAEDGNPPPCPVSLHLLPEFTGSILVALRRSRPSVVANLDMVGGREGDVGGNWFHPPPAPLIGRATGNAFMLARTAYQSEGLWLELKPFTAGSDHVPFIFSGSQSFMVNQWPDKYYHSDQDDVDRISKTHLGAAAKSLTLILAAGAHQALGRNDNTFRMFLEYYLLRLSENHAVRGDRNGLGLVASTLKASLGLPFETVSHPEGPPWEPWMRSTYPKLLEYPLMSPGQLVHTDLEAAIRLAEVLRPGTQSGGVDLDLYTSAFIEPQILADGSRSLAYIIEVIAAEHGTRASALIPRTIEILQDAGVMTLS